MKLPIFSQNARKVGKANPQRPSGSPTLSHPPDEGPAVQDTAPDNNPFAGQPISAAPAVESTAAEDWSAENRRPITRLPASRHPVGGPTMPLRPGDSHPVEAPQMSLADLRLTVINRIYLIGSIVGVLAVLINLPGIIQNGRWGILALYAIVAGIVIIFAIRRDINYPVRAFVVVAALFALGLLILLNEGLYGSGRVFLLGMAIIAAILSGRRSQIAALVIALATLLVIGLAMVIGIIPPPVLSPGAGNSSLISWVTGFMGFAIVVLVAVLSLQTILDGLEHSFEGQKQLTGELQRERASLEARIHARTEHLERRLVQIRTASEITRSISQVLDINVLLPQVCDLVQERFDLYYVGIFLVEENLTGQENYAVLAAGTGEAGRRMLENKHRLQIGGDSMIGSSIATRKPRIALDVGQEAVRFSNPFLPRTRSELALPILVGSRGGLGTGGSETRSNRPGGSPTDKSGDVENERALGAITIQSEAEAAFDEDDILVLQLIADALAGAIENARLLATTQESLEEVRSVHRTYLESAWSQVRQARGELAYTYQADLGQEDGQAHRPDGQAHRPAPTNTGDGEVDTNRLETAIRLRDQVIGHLVLEGMPVTEWSTDQQALIETVANQAALALENARLLEETRMLAEQERAASNLTTKIWSSTNIEHILSNLLGELGATLNASDGWIELWPGGQAAQMAQVTAQGGVAEPTAGQDRPAPTGAGGTEVGHVDD